MTQRDHLVLRQVGRIGSQQARLVEAFLSLGLNDEAQTAGAILGHNFQSTDWYEDSYKLLTARGLKARDMGNNWLSQIYRQSIKGEWL